MLKLPQLWRQVLTGSCNKKELFFEMYYRLGSEAATAVERQILDGYYKEKELSLR